MLVPRFVEQFHEAHAAFDQPARQDAVVGERWTSRLGPVHVEHVLWLLGNVHQLRRARLHAVGHLEGTDAGLDLGIADFLQAHAVQASERIQRVALESAVDAGRIGQIQDRVAAGAELHSLVHGRQEAAAPVGVAAAGAFLA